MKDKMFLFLLYVVIVVLIAQTKTEPVREYVLDELDDDEFWNITGGYPIPIEVAGNPSVFGKSDEAIFQRSPRAATPPPIACTIHVMKVIPYQGRCIRLGVGNKAACQHEEYISSIAKECN